MTLIIDELHQKHTVMVDGGSGVLIQPMTDQYTYVLTAKHNILVDSNDPNSSLKCNTDISVINYDGDSLKVLDLVSDPSPDVDIAIILIDCQPNLSLFMHTYDLSNGDRVKLCGYPDNRRSPQKTVVEQYSSYRLQFHEHVNNTLIFNNDNVAAYENIIGFSGGGLFTFGDENGDVFLCGIETKMDGNPELEPHGRVAGISIRKFENIIENGTYSGEPLAVLLPLHLASFEHLLNQIFKLEDWHDGNKLQFIKDHLRQLATSNVISVNLTPHDLLNEFSEYIRVDGRNDHELHKKELWAYFLELLVISFLLDNPIEINKEYVREVLEKRRLTYIASNGTWKAHAKDILSSSHKGLREDGVIVACTHKASNTALCTSQELKKVVDNIGSPLSDPRLITNIKRNISVNKRLVDLAALHHKCIQNKEDDYRDYNCMSLDALNVKLSQEYGYYLKAEGVDNEE